jgi:hypothetical protein
MVRFFVVLLVVFLMAVPGIVLAEKGPVEDWFGMLEVQGGSTWDFKTACARLYAAGKLGGYKGLTGVLGTEFDTDKDTEAEGPVTGLLGVTYNLGNFRDWGVDISWAKHFGVNVGACVTYDWTEDIWGWRAMASVIDLSFSGGGADRQKNR